MLSNLFKTKLLYVVCATLFAVLAVTGASLFDTQQALAQANEKNKQLKKDYQIALLNEATLKTNQVELESKLSSYESDIATLNASHIRNVELMQAQLEQHEKQTKITTEKTVLIKSIKSDKTGELNAQNCLDINVPDDFYRLHTSTAKTSGTSYFDNDQIRTDRAAKMDDVDYRKANTKKQFFQAFSDSKLRI